MSPRSYRIRLALFNEIKILTRLSKSKYVVRLIDFEHNTVSSMICNDSNHLDIRFESFQEGENTLYLLMEKGECDLSHILNRLQGCNSIDIFVGPESGPKPGPSHVWSFETCLNL